MTSSSVGKGIAISGMFFMLGLCFGSLSSRMATIKDGLQLSDGVFGSAILTNAVLLSLVPLASSVYQLAALLFVSGFSYSAVNVSNNTQASLSEALSGKTELPFFHGIWGLAGFVGAGFGALMIGQDFALSTHFGVISVIAFLAALACWRFLHDQPGAERVGRAFAMPDRRLFNYGLIVFFSMACEGIMYDWSVVYFQDVVSAERQLVGVGFMVFMGAMTVGRLLLNRVADRFGTRSTLQWSGGLALIGMVTTIAYPSLPASIIGFCLVGLGICTVIPLVAGAAARSACVMPSARAWSWPSGSSFGRERYRGKLRRSFDHALDRSGNLPHGRFAERYALLACRLR